MYTVAVLRHRCLRVYDRRPELTQFYKSVVLLLLLQCKAIRVYMSGVARLGSSFRVVFNCKRPLRAYLFSCLCCVVIASASRIVVQSYVQLYTSVALLLLILLLCCVVVVACVSWIIDQS